MIKKTIFYCSIVLYNGALVGMASPRRVDLCWGAASNADAGIAASVFERDRIEMALHLGNDFNDIFISAHPQGFKDLCETNELSITNPFTFDLLVFYRKFGGELQLVRIAPEATRRIEFDRDAEYNVNIRSSKTTDICDMPFSLEE